MSWITVSELMRYKQLGDLPEARGAALDDSAGDARILLIYSQFEKELVEAACQFIRSHGVSCRIETLCAETPPAEKDLNAALKRSIQFSNKIIFLAGNEAFRSTWLPWFLAYSESFKVRNNIALLPVADESRYWLGDGHRSEYGYFDFYPRIGKFIRGYWCLMHPTKAGEHIRLSQWFKKTAPEPIQLHQQPV